MSKKDSMFENKRKWNRIESQKNKLPWIGTNNINKAKNTMETQSYSRPLPFNAVCYSYKQYASTHFIILFVVNKQTRCYYKQK